ncbi:MAG: PEP-CTERM sorting domain-containing protein, partial [Thermoguttaceae bacterium]|nr:PEP-CTERM sorting domain-containing protein [Thermoguttaceae bacterium]
YGNLTSAADAKLTVDGGLSVSGDLKLSKDITLIVDDFENNFTLVDVLGTLTIPADAMIELTATEPAVDPTNDILLFSANAIVDESGNALTTETLLGMIEFDEQIFPLDAGWNYILDATASGIWLKADPNAVPEPATWVLLLAGFGILGSRKLRGRK